MHVDRSDRPEILPASVTPAHSDGKARVVDLACPRKAIFHHWHAAALSDSGLARCREEIRRVIADIGIVRRHLPQEVACIAWTARVFPAQLRLPYSKVAGRREFRGCGHGVAGRV